MATRPRHQMLPLLMSVLVFLGTVTAKASETWQGAAFEGDTASLARLAEAGAKVVRTYRASDAWVLDEAQQLGMKVVMGLWLEHPRHGFDYADAAALRAQEEAVLETVVRYRDHPALLAWGVGNEIETGVADPLPLWREVDRLAGLIEQLDPNHPTLPSSTVTLASACFC